MGEVEWKNGSALFFSFFSLGVYLSTCLKGVDGLRQQIWLYFLSFSYDAWTHSFQPISSFLYIFYYNDVMSGFLCSRRSATTLEMGGEGTFYCQYNHKITLFVARMPLNIIIKLPCGQLIEKIRYSCWPALVQHRYTLYSHSCTQTHFSTLL